MSLGSPQIKIEPVAGPQCTGLEERSPGSLWAEYWPQICQDKSLGGWGAVKLTDCCHTGKQQGINRGWNAQGCPQPAGQEEVGGMRLMGGRQPHLNVSQRDPRKEGGSERWLSLVSLLSARGRVCKGLHVALGVGVTAVQGLVLAVLVRGCVCWCLLGTVTRGTWHLALLHPSKRGCLRAWRAEPVSHSLILADHFRVSDRKSE